MSQNKNGHFGVYYAILPNSREKNDSIRSLGQSLLSVGTSIGDMFVLMGRRVLIGNQEFRARIIRTPFWLGRH